MNVGLFTLVWTASLPPGMRPQSGAIKARGAAHGGAMRKSSNGERAHFGRSPEGLGHDSASRRYRLLACRSGHATRAMPSGIKKREIEIMAEVAATHTSAHRPKEASRGY